MSKELQATLLNCMKFRKDAAALEQKLYDYMEENCEEIMDCTEFEDHIQSKLSYSAYTSLEEFLNDIELAKQGRWLEVGEG